MNYFLYLSYMSHETEKWKESVDEIVMREVRADHFHKQIQGKASDQIRSVVEKCTRNGFDI